MKIIQIFLTALAMWTVSANAAMTFVHPGALSTQQDLDFVKQQISKGAQPWKSEFELVKNSTSASRKPHALTHINSRNNSEANIIHDDALAAYSQALLWVFSGEEIYAERSVAILNAWSILQGFTSGSDQDKLQAGWIGAVFAPAAEIMRSYDGWSASEVASFQTMFKRAFYPQLKTVSPWNGNVDLTQIDAMMSIAVFNEDEQLFNQGLARLERRNPSYFYLTSDGDTPPAIDGDGGDVQAFWSQPTQWVDGLNQETCRDNGHHSQYALGSALHAAEVAWNQGVDVYTINQARFTAAMELMASQLLSGTVDTCTDTKATTDRYNTWEVGYNHYHNRAGIELPNTRMLIVQQIRTNSQRATWNLIYETLTHAELPAGNYVRTQYQK
ncbi:MAG: alginate lyase family protein [Pseudomonadales bacterium]